MFRMPSSIGMMVCIACITPGVSDCAVPTPTADFRQHSNSTVPQGIRTDSQEIVRSQSPEPSTHFNSPSLFTKHHAQDHPKFTLSDQKRYGRKSTEPRQAEKRRAFGTAGGSVGTQLSSAARRLTDSFAGRKKTVSTEDSFSEPFRPATDPPSLIGEESKVPVVRAGLEQSRDDDAKAVELYQRTLDIEPTSFDALISYARMLDRKNRFSEATTFYQRAAQAHPHSGTVFNDLGLCHARQGNLQESIRALTRAVELDSDNTLYRNNIATVLVTNRQVQEAWEHLAAAHGEAVAHYNLGYLLHRQGQDHLSRQQFMRALDTDPSLAPAQSMLDRLAPVAAYTYPGKSSSLRMPEKFTRTPQIERAEAAPLPHGDTFLYTDSTLQHFPELSSK